MVRPQQQIPVPVANAGVPVPVVYDPLLFPNGVWGWCVIHTSGINCGDFDINTIDTATNTITITSWHTDYTNLTLRVEGYLPDE